MERYRERANPLIEEIKKLHASMGFNYRFPDLDGRAILGKMIVHDKHGEVSAAGALKLVGEAFLWVNLEASTREKIRAIRKLSQGMASAGKFSGIEEVSCWVPPEIEPTFAHMLANLGWQKSPWQTWTILLK